MNGVPLEGNGVISTQFIRTATGWKMSSMARDAECALAPGLRERRQG
jgi:hypothetical protein